MITKFHSGGISHLHYMESILNRFWIFQSYLLMRKILQQFTCVLIIVLWFFSLIVVRDCPEGSFRHLLKFFAGLGKFYSSRFPTNRKCFQCIVIKGRLAFKINFADFLFSPSLFFVEAVRVCALPGLQQGKLQCFGRIMWDTEWLSQGWLHLP